MLSATVPNTIEFAGWVGRTKKRKIYVISTLKRPIPLEHYLYTGTDGKSKDEIFLLQDASGKFLETGHRKAELAKKARESKTKQVQIPFLNFVKNAEPLRSSNCNKSGFFPAGIICIFFL